jgi:hypothetical protein
VEDIKEILNDVSDEEDEDASPTNSYEANHQGFIFGFSSTNVDMLTLHPSPELIPRMWEIFKVNVDPLVKVLHIPTVEPIILSAKDNLEHISKTLEPLMFAIYYGTSYLPCLEKLLLTNVSGAVTSLTAQDCVTEMGEAQPILLTRYRFALEQALARASFMDSEEMIVLQAVVIFLIVLRRNDDARIIWTLTGLVVRIAQTIGIHRDGSHFALTPFEIEMRRRLWWQVCILDARAS